MKQYNNGESERIFRDKTDQRSWFDVLQKKYKNEKEKLSSQEKEAYEEIQKALLLYEHYKTKKQYSDKQTQMLDELKNILEEINSIDGNISSIEDVDNINRQFNDSIFNRKI